MQGDLYQKISIIVLGESGTGKSLFCKKFSGSADFVSMQSANSFTKEITPKVFKVDSKKVEITLLDTPGMNDSTGKDIVDKYIKDIKKYLKEQKQRINCIIIVFNAQNERLLNSTKESIKNICKIFPLPEFWEHVILFWTHWYFPSEEDEENKKYFIENGELGMMKVLKDLSIEINKAEKTINPITKSLHMIFNEYSEATSNPQKKKKSEEKMQKNFDKIIDLAKNMKPLYEDIVEPKEEIELKDPKDGIIQGKNRKFKYEKILIRRFKDFKETNLIESKEIVKTFFITEIETDWEKIPQESNEQQKQYKYKKYKKRIFTDEKGIEFEPGNDILNGLNKQKIEIINEKIVQKKTENKPVEGKPKRTKKIIYNNVKYNNQNNWVREDEEVVEEIEEGETEWRKDPNENRPNIERNIKYKTITKYDGKGNKIGNTEIKTDIVDWEEITTIIEKDVATKIDDKTTLKKDKISTIRKSKKNPEGETIKTEFNKENKIEEFKYEYVPVNALDKFNIGHIKYVCYKVKYVNGIKCENEPKIPFPANDYFQYYKRDNQQKQIFENRNGKNFEISFNEIYMEDSRYPNKKNTTDYKYKIGEKEMNVKTTTETREEKIEKDKIYKQCFRLYYKIDKDGNEIFDREEKEGDIQIEDVKYSEEYYNIQEPMTSEKIDELRKEKKYPISFQKIYYKKELNTKAKNEIPTGKIENVELKLENKVDINDNEENIQLIEITYINGIENVRMVVEQSNKNFIIKEETEQVIEDNKIKKQKYKNYYYYDQNGEEKLHHKEIIENPDYFDIEYGQEFYEEIERKENGSKIYPITFKRVYYKKEINTGRNEKIETGKVENVEIKLEHKVDITKTEDKNIKKREEYDVEVTYVNGIKTKTNTENKMNYTSSIDNGILKEYKFTKKKERALAVRHFFSANEYLVDTIEVTRIVYKDGHVKEIESVIKTDIEQYHK